MYSCNKPRLPELRVGSTVVAKFESTPVCRFVGRYDELHQNNGCRGCTREWDVNYLRQWGLLK
jgi:hypothetical protein